MIPSISAKDGDSVRVLIDAQVASYRAGDPGLLAAACREAAEGSVRWEKVIPALKKAGYDGYLTAELSAMPKTPEYLYESTVKALDTILAM